MASGARATERECEDAILAAEYPPLTQAVLVAKLPSRNGSTPGMVFDLGRMAEIHVERRYDYAETYADYFEVRPMFMGYDINVLTREDASMLWVADFDDLFQRVRADAHPSPDPGPFLTIPPSSKGQS